MSCWSHLLLLPPLLLAACAKKPSKPQHNAPWLAHPSASAVQPDAPQPGVPLHLAAGSSLSIELKSKKQTLRGTIKTVTGTVELNPTNLGATHAHFEADLRSLVMTNDAGDDPAATTRALRALEIPSDAHAENASASFALGELEELSAPSLLPSHARPDAGSAGRHARATAVGQLLLHGYRVGTRVPIEADIGYSATGEPVSLVIRSHAPLVVTLATHQIALPGSEALPRDARVSFEFYLEK